MHAQSVYRVNMDVTKYNIICFSNQLWDFPFWTNKKQIMYRLGKNGHNVLFVDPPINPGFVFLKQLVQGKWDLTRLITQCTTDKDSGVKIYTPINFFPFFGLMSKFHAFRIKNLTKELFDKRKKRILWVYHVQIIDLFKYIATLKHDVLVYDCVDNYSAFPANQSLVKTTVSPTMLKEHEKKLTKKADVIFATAPGLVEHLAKWSDDVHFTPNVGDYKKFKDVKKIKKLPQDIADIKRPIVGFTGALDTYKFDLELFKKIASDHPSYSFVLIGQTAMKDKDPSKEDIGLGEFSNVYFLGPKDYSIVHNYFAAFDAYIIPYVLNDYTVGGCFPTKFHDSLAAGLPTIVTDLPAYMPFKDVSYISKTYEEFSANIKTALTEDSPKKIKSRQKIAKSNTYDGKANKMLDIIDSKLNEL